jgi:hypothetical protein
MIFVIPNKNRDRTLNYATASSFHTYATQEYFLIIRLYGLSYWESR